MIEHENKKLNAQLYYKANEQLSKEKKMRDSQEYQHYQAPPSNHFPFNHGEQVDTLRKRFRS